MFRLRMLGQMDLRDPDGCAVTAVLVQPKRLGLLAYLAVTGASGFQRRDLLLPLFWPELTEARARNALRQALHQLRRALGADVVLSRGTDMLAVDESRLWCDARAFEAALSRGALDEAIALYEGDLLPGFAVEGATEFDRWLDDTRMFLRRRATRAAWALADRRERTGDAAGAIESARLASSLGIDDETGLRQLVTLLDRVGDPRAALEAYAAFAHRLERSTGEQPASETKALIEAIRTRPRAVQPAAGDLATVPDPPRVTVVPLVNLGGDPSSDYVGRLVCDAIAEGLVRTRTVAVVTSDRPDASSDAMPNVGFVVTGSYFLRGDSWCFQAKVSDAAGRVLDTVGEVAAPRLQPWDAADELRRRVCGTLAGRFDPRFASLADAVAQAPDLVAHLELALGVELHLRGDFRTAIPHLLRAARAREGFTFAALWAIQASCNLGEWEQAEAIVTELLDRSREGNLSTLENLACEYYTACIDGQQGAALRIVRLAATLVPNSEVLSELGRRAIFCNHPHAAVEALTRLDPSQGWIPSWTPHWRRLTEAHHMLGEHARELDAARQGRMHHPEAISAVLYESRAHAAVGNLEALSRCIDEACAFPPDRFADAGEVMLEAARELRAHGHGAEAAALAERAIAWYTDPQPRQEGRVDAHDRHVLARAYYEGGQWDNAARVVRELAAESPDDLDVIALVGAIAARLGDDAAARDALGTLQSKKGRFRFGLQFVCSARLLAILGESDQAISALRGGFARGYCHGIDLHTDIDLALLGAEPSFRELLRPKG
jgi:DNA-binding SARP family transcriptional activator/tetratricopeptide (TPR) repeat protein